MSQEYAHTKQSDGRTQSHKNVYAAATSLILDKEAIIWLSKAERSSPEELTNFEGEVSHWGLELWKCSPYTALNSVA